MKGVLYIGPVKDQSGYGEACRNYILALNKAGVPLTVETRSFEANPPPVGTENERKIIDSLIGKDVEFDIVIVHLTPDLAPQYVAKYPGKYVISYTVWETSQLHPLWVDACNKMDEVWVPCQWNVDSFKSSGVTVPMLKIPHGIDPESFSNVVDTPSFISGIDKENTFVFYSIMQWNTRKNPDGLLRAYFNAFKEKDDVRLVLKAYVGRGLSPQEDARQIKAIIGKLKSDMQLPYYPKISLITHSLSTDQMKSLHLFGDAYISLTHGEGFGLTAFEAGLAGNPVIMTGMGGNMEFLTEDNSYLVPYMWDYVYGMGNFNPWYWGSQQWGRPSLIEAADLMRYVYTHREEAKEKAAVLQKRIVTEFSWEVVVRPMISRLKEI